MTLKSAHGFDACSAKNALPSLVCDILMASNGIPPNPGTFFQAIPQTTQSPLDDKELDTVKTIIVRSYEFATGETLPAA